MPTNPPDTHPTQGHSAGNFLIDTHCHLHDREFFTPEQASAMLARAAKHHVSKIICIGTDVADSLAAQAFSEQDFTFPHPEIYWTFGIHPENATKPYEIPPFSPTNSPIAIGEVGLDYHYAGYDRAAEIRLLENMLQLATDRHLPVSFHVREAFDDFFGVIANFPHLSAVVHSFSDNKKHLRRLLSETDFYIGVNGLATYSTLPTPPLDRIVLETDAPFLTPTPFRGIINEPGYVCEVAKWLATTLGQDYNIIEQETTKNARRLFHF